MAKNRDEKKPKGGNVPEAKGGVRMARCTMCAKPHELPASELLQHQAQVRRLQSRQQHSSGARAR